VSLEVNEATGRIRGYFDPSGPTGADLQRPLKDGKEHDATVIAGFREHHTIRMPTRPRSADRHPNAPFFPQLPNTSPTLVPSYPG